MTLGLSNELEVAAHSRDTHPAVLRCFRPQLPDTGCLPSPETVPAVPDQGRFSTDAQNYRGKEARGAPDRRLSTLCTLE
jgi:hypothetical protein